MTSRGSAARAFVRSMRPVIHSHYERHGRQGARATITSLHGTPGARIFVAQAHDSDLVLNETNTTLGQHIVTYDMHTGLAVGDTLIALEMGEGDWTAVDVESDTDPTPAVPTTELEAEVRRLEELIARSP